MLTQITHWLDVSATAIDALLVARILQLRLQRVYLWVTLACVLAVLFDGVELWLGANSEENRRVFLYSRFLYAIVYPLVAWDVFEEMKNQVSKLRRLGIARLVSGLFFAALFGFIMTLFVSTDQQGETTGVLALILWAGSCAATLAFLWSLRRGLKTQKMTPAHNTFVWMTFYQLVLAAEVLACFGQVAAAFLNARALDIVNVCFVIYGIAITIWCVTKLRRIPSDVSTPAKTADIG